VHLQYLGFPIINDPLYADESCWQDGMNDLTDEQMDKVKEHIEKKYFPVDLGVDGEEVLGCAECVLNRKDPTEESLILYLHAWKYEGPNWAFETDTPLWAV